MMKKTIAVNRTNKVENVELFGAELYYLVRKTITNMAEKFNSVLSYDKVQDLIQDTYLKVCDKKANYNPSGNFAGWVYRICQNCLRDSLTAKGKSLKKFYAIDEDFDDEDDDTVDVDSTSVLEDYTFAANREILEAEFKEHFWKCMFKLSSESREVIELLIEGKPYKEMATILGCTEGTLRVKVYRARKELKGFIESLPEYALAV